MFNFKLVDSNSTQQTLTAASVTEGARKIKSSAYMDEL